MPSSTSSSDREIEIARSPALAWARIGLASFVVVLVGIVAWELGWRARGFRASTPMTADDFIVAMHRLEPDSTVLLGTSRTESDFDLDAFEAAWPGRRPLLLTFSGSSPLLILEALAEEESFRGTVLMGVLPRIASRGHAVGENAPKQHLEAWRSARQSPGAIAEAHLSAYGWQWSATRTPELEPAALVRAAIGGRLPRPKSWWRDPERRVWMEFPSRRDPRRIRYYERRFSTDQAEPALRTSLVGRYVGAIRELESRGARVVLLRLPAYEKCREIEERVYPKAEWWDVLVRAAGVPAIHFSEDPALTPGGPGDCSHLDWRDAPAFTKAWVSRIRAVLGE